MLGHLGKYRLDTRLGGGGMAEVFIASAIGAEGFSRKVAIKRVLPGYSENPQFAQMFISEAQLSSRLQHPNIVSVTDFDRDAEGRLFLVMELIEGKDLDAILSTGLLPFPVVNFILTEMLRGLGYAHDLPAGSDDLRGLVHRDVSPHNVLVSWEGAVKVSDFGIAKARQASEATASVFIKGKPAYMSPEQANGEPLDGRSDLFAVGVMLWEMLVGRRLFAGGDTRSLLAQVLFAPIPRPRQQRAEVPRDLDLVCMKLLERTVAARYASGEEVIADLLACESAPKGGREELVALLAERFSQEMPRRQTRRAQSRAASAGPGIPTPIPNAPMAPGMLTVRGHAAAPSQELASAQPQAWGPSQAPAQTGGAGPALPLGSASGSVPSASYPPPATSTGYAPQAGSHGSHGSVGPMHAVDQVMAAHTRTLAPPPRSRGLAIGVSVGLLAVAGAIVFAVLMSTRADERAQQGADAGPLAAGSTTAAADAASLETKVAAAGTTQADAAVGATDDARGEATEVDAGSGAAGSGAQSEPGPQSGSGQSEGTPRPDKEASAPRKGKGTLRVATIPPMDVYINNRLRGSAPVVVALPAGNYKVLLRDPETKRRVDEIPITIEASKEQVIRRSYD